MANHHDSQSSKRNRPTPHPSVPRISALWFALLAIGTSAVIAVILFRPPKGGTGDSVRGMDSSPPPTHSAAAFPTAPGAPATNRPAPPIIEINQAVMVTVELDFGTNVPTIAEALRQIERRHQPDDGQGRTFAILDAYGGPTPDGRKLHLSMHVSTERPGLGSLVFRRTGEVLWQNRIVATTNKPAISEQQLSIYLDSGNNRMLTVDGSSNPASLLEANIKEAGRPLRELWNDGDFREIIFIYSACGCPVKVMCRRAGQRLLRTSTDPVIFPDDPAVVAVINRLMNW